MRQQVFFLIITTVLLASCQHEREWEGAPEIKAKVESEKETRTSLSVDESGAGTIYWNPSDKIDVFFGTKKVHYTSQNTSDATIATFKTSESVSGSDVSSTNIWGLYPSSNSSTCNGSSITTTLPSTQYGVPNTFDKDLFPAVAHSSSTDLQFYNVCGGIKFNLAYDDIKKITFRGNNNEDLAGTVSISFEDNLPKATIVNGVKEITLTPKTGTTFTKGADYYFILLPGTLSAGFTITFTATDGTTGTLSYTDNPVTIKRSIFGKKGNMDVYAAFSDDRQPNNVIYYTSSDGLVVAPYKSSFGADIVSNEYVAGKGIITFDGMVRYIGDKALYYSSSLTSITIPNTVTHIYDNAFFNCSGLTSIAIPNSVINIGHYAFEGCSGLTSITIPNSVTSIASGSFAGCHGLTSISVENDNPSYDSRDNCNAIINTATNELVSGCRNTIIPDSVTSIGSWAFSGCAGLTSIAIPNSVTSIGYRAFQDCSGLTSISIPNSVTVIGGYAFSGCSGLISISIPNSVTSIGGAAVFDGCCGLISISVENDNPSYDSRNDCNAIINTTTNELFLGCKNTIIPDSVTSIGAGAFRGCIGLTSIAIPNSVTSIKRLAFRDCSGLTSISIPNSIMSIGDYAFVECSALTSIKVYAEVPPELGDNVFRNTNDSPIYVPSGSVDAYKAAWSIYADRIQAMPQPTNIIYYTSSDGKIVTPYAEGDFGANIVSNEYVDGKGIILFDGPVSKIGKQAFWACDNLVSMDIPNTVQNIGNSAFQYCNSLFSFVIPDSVTSIGDWAFWGCHNLHSIIIPDAVMSLGLYNPFGANKSLASIRVQSGNPIFDSRDNCNAIIETATNVLVSGCRNTVIPHSVTGIGIDAFCGCFELASIFIPASVSSIAQGAFSDCTIIQSIQVESGNPSYDSRQNCNAIIETETNTLMIGCMNSFIPESVTTIGNNAFSACSDLPSIVFPSSVTVIGEMAFERCTGLTSLAFPKTITNIDAYAFLFCSGLTSIIFYGKNPPVLGKEALRTNNNCPIFVPIEAVDDYKNAPGWESYSSRIQAMPDSHEAVDLGLSVKWATCNVGASAPEEYGDYFAWGETAPKDTYDYAHYQWLAGYDITKYHFNYYGDSAMDGVIDNKLVLDLEDDAAHMNWGGDWRMPTSSEITELIQNCTWTGATQNGVFGLKVTGKNGNSIFIPAAGKKVGTDIVEATMGQYWSSTLNQPFVTHAGQLEFRQNSDSYGGVSVINPCYYDRRFDGCPIRPVFGAFVSVEGVSLNKTSLTLTEGAEEQLTALVSPSDATFKGVTWSCSDYSIATVELDGTVTAVSAGTATITAWASNGVKSATCALTVLPKAESN